MAAVDRDHIPTPIPFVPLEPQFSALRADTDVPGSIIGEVGTVIAFPFLDRIPSLAKIDQDFVMSLFSLQ